MTPEMWTATALGVLRTIEWAGERGGDACCPCCKGYQSMPGHPANHHHPGCYLRKLLDLAPLFPVPDPPPRTAAMVKAIVDDSLGD